MKNAPTDEKQNLENLGHTLRTERERQGLTKRDMALRTRIPLDQIEIIEDGRSSSLPPVFTKGFIRSYVNELGLDAESILEEYRNLTGGYKNEPAGLLTPRYVEMNVHHDGAPRPRILVILLMLIAGLAAAYYFSPRFREAAISIVPFLPPLEDRSEQGLAEPGTVLDLTEAEPGDVTLTSEVLNLTPVLEPMILPAAAAPPGFSEIQEPEAARAREGGDLVLTCQKDTWLQVEVDGRAPEFISFKAGDERGWEAKREIIVITGNAGALAAKWNGQVMDVLGEERAVRVVF